MNGNRGEAPGLRRGVDRALGLLCDLVLGIFFRRIEVVGRHRIPRRESPRQPLIVVANHVNGLIDPLFVLGPLGLPARMLGKSTLWKIPVLRQILDLAGVLPVFRPTDAGVDPSRNAETFARCHEELARGGRIAIFPEGTSHDDPRMKPLRTGAARIALEAERRFGPLGVLILPVGLIFEERTRFRSRALVVVGEPFPAAVGSSASPASSEPAATGEDDGDAVRALTARISEALGRVTLNYSSWEDARLIELGADIWDRDRKETDAPPQRSRRMAAEYEVRRALTSGLETLRQTHPEAVAPAVAAARDYERLLRLAGLTDDQVSARHRPLPAAAFATRILVRLLVTLPVAVVGTALNLPSWLAVEAIARRFGDEPNQVATFKVFPALVLFPGAWAVEVAAAWRWLGGESALAIALVAPLSGWIALRWHEKRETLWRESRAFLLLRWRGRIAEELRARRARVEEQIERLVERWRVQVPADSRPGVAADTPAGGA